MSFASSGGLTSHDQLPDVGSLVTPHTANDIPSVIETVSNTVVGTSVQRLAVTGLDLASDYLYICSGCLINRNGGATDLSIYLGTTGSIDETATNYYLQRFIANNATVAGARVNSAVIRNIANAEKMAFKFYLRKDEAGYPVILGEGTAALGTSLTLNNFAIHHTSASNVQELELYMSGADGIGNGSELTVFKLSK